MNELQNKFNDHVLVNIRCRPKHTLILSINIKFIYYKILGNWDCFIVSMTKLLGTRCIRIVFY